MHLESPYLDLKMFCPRTKNGRMQTLIVVRFRHRDIIFETSRNRFEVGMDITKDFIAVLLSLGDDPQSHNVINLVEGVMFDVHFFVDRVDGFDTIQDFEGYVCRSQNPLELALQFVQTASGVLIDRFHFLLDASVFFRLAVEERQFLEFRLYFV